MPQSILQISELLRQGSVSPVELTTDCLARIEKLNPKLNAFITVTAESALAQARQAEAEIRRGDWRGPLHGIPLALKDLIDTAGVRTTAASFMFKDRIPSRRRGSCSPPESCRRGACWESRICTSSPTAAVRW